MSTSKSKYTKPNVGSVFAFTVRKELKLEPDFKSYYLITDSDGENFLIPSENYQAYGIQTGDTIKCKLDRINCDGEIFFEPQHPYYSEGSIYTFQVLGFEIVQNYFGFDETILMVKDKLGVEQWIRNAKNITFIQQKIEARVHHIKKGHLFLQAVNGKEKNSANPFEKYTILDEIHTERFNRTYLLNDEACNYHFLPIEPYRAYGYKTGMSFLAQIVKVSTKGFLYLEPKHPHYQIGAYYTFAVIDFLEDKNRHFAFVEDILGNVIKVEIMAEVDQIGKTVMCKVTAITKGKPELEME